MKTAPVGRSCSNTKKYKSRLVIVLEIYEAIGGNISRLVGQTFCFCVYFRLSFELYDGSKYILDTWSLELKPLGRVWDSF